MRRILLIGALLALAACHPSHQDAGPAPIPDAVASTDLTAGAAAAHAAAVSFLALAGDSSHSGKIPHAADPVAAPLVDAVFDMRDVPTEPVPMSQLPVIDDWLTSVEDVGRAYVLAGAGAARDDDPSGPVVSAQVDKNFAAYAPELGRYLDAQNALTSLEAASIVRQLAADPASADRPDIARKVAAFHGPLIKDLQAMLFFMGVPGPSDDWRRARMPYLLSLSTQAAKLNSPADLAPLRTSIMAVGEASDDATLRADLGEMLRDLGGSG
jgi:hypothetical protein